jgi:creatinine amidohydrolase
VIDGEIFLGNMRWPDVVAAAAAKPVLILPVGAIEQHGPHLPLDTDSAMVSWLACTAARQAGCALVAPTLNYGVSLNHIAFPGTATMRNETLCAVLADLGESLLGHAFKAIVFLNGNGGNNVAVASAAAELRRRTAKTVANIYVAALIEEAVSVMESGIIWHADESETSMMLAIAPERVHMAKAVREMPKPIPHYEFKEATLTKAMVDLGIPATERVTKSGTIGDATMATVDKGRPVVEEQLKNLTKILKTLAAA